MKASFKRLRARLRACLGLHQPAAVPLRKRKAVIRSKAYEVHCDPL